MIDSSYFGVTYVITDNLFIEKLTRHCCNITWSNLVRVTISSRLEGRAPQCLLNFLENI